MANYTLTSNGDNLIGSANNDTFNATYDAAVTDTFSNQDSLNGGTGVNTLHIDHLLDVAITPPDDLWAKLSNIQNVVINTTGNGAQTITTGVNFQAAFAPLGVDLTTTTSGAGAIDITMTTFTGTATLRTTSTSGAQTIVTGSGATTVVAVSDAGALNIKGVGLNKVFATTTGAGAQTIGDGSGNGVNLAVVNATSAGGAQTITSTSKTAVVVVVTSAAGKQIITTGSGADIITASTTNATNTIDTGDGNDKVTIEATTSGNYTINAGVGNDTITGGAGSDTLIGGLGNDILNGGTGADSMTGGTGNDIYYVDNSGDQVIEALNDGTDNVFSTITYILGANLENLTLTGISNINGTGNSLNNSITGNSGNNSLNGDAGNDTLNGGTGADSMTGGTGNDIYYVDNSGDQVIEALNGGTDTVFSTINYILGANLENLTLTGISNINGTGNSLNNSITGNSGNNSLNGDAGNDTLNGGTGADSMTGGAGNDIYYVDNSGDQVIEALSGGTDTVFSTITYILGENLENLTLTGISSINGTGNSLNNLITGNSGNNNLSGGDGNDTLNGGIGVDSMTGGTGDDIYYVDNSGDQVIEALNGGTDTVFSTITYILNENLENLTLTGISSINGTGNNLNNSITGNSGNNSLSGGDGNDTLIGGKGNDTLIGGTGNDFFRFNSPLEGIDLITDFSVTDDKILVSRSGFGGGLVSGILPSNQFTLGSSATTSANRFFYNSSNGGLFFDADGNGTGSAAIQIATLTGMPTLSNTNIVVIA